MTYLLFMALALSFTASLCLYRLIGGPTVPDKIVAAQVIGTNTMAVLVLIAAIYDQPMFVDISLTYAMLSFLAVLAVARYLGGERVIRC